MTPTFKVRLTRLLLPGLADECPDGTEESQMAEVEAEVEKYSSEVKQLKDRNSQVRGTWLTTFHNVVQRINSYSVCHIAV